MKAIVKAVWSVDHDLETYIPVLPHCFSIDIEINISYEGLEGVGIYYLTVCNPEYLQRYCDSQGISIWGRHTLILLEYDYMQIKNKILKYVDSCEGGSVDEITQKLSRMFKWEYDEVIWKGNCQLDSPHNL